MELEEQLVVLKRGKWSVPGVPHKGWQCIGIDDLGAPDETCEMCESQVIRYIHHMQHPNYGDVLRVGCICAGHMEDDLVGAKVRDAHMRYRSGKRSRWLRRRWKISKKGNDWIKADGFVVAVFPGKNTWRAVVSSKEKNYLRRSKLTYKTKDEAKLAAFNLITKLLLKNNWS